MGSKKEKKREKTTPFDEIDEILHNQSLVPTIPRRANTAFRPHPGLELTDKIMFFPSLS